MHERVHHTDERRDFRRRHEAGEDEVLVAADLFGQALEPSAPHAVADEQEADVRDALGQARRDGEQVVVPLQLEEPGNLADDKVARRQAKRLAFCVGVFRIEEWLQVEAAWDARVVVRLADAGGEVLVAHRVGDGDEVVGHPAGETLGTAE